MRICEDGYDCFGVGGVWEEDERQAVKVAGEGDDEVFNVVGEVEGDAFGRRGLCEVGSEDVNPAGDFL